MLRLAATSMPTHEIAHPVHISFLGLQAIVKKTNALTQLIKQPGRVKNRDGDFARINIPVCKYSIKRQLYEIK